MSGRERMTVLVIGGLVGLWALYGVVNWVFISPVTTANAQIKRLDKEYRDLKAQRDKVKRYADEWKEIAGRSYAFNLIETQNAFQTALKRLAAKHQLTGQSIQNASTGKLPGTDIVTVKLRVNGEGSLANVAAFLRDIYQLPVLLNITKLRLSPVTNTDGTQSVRIGELLIETIIPPEIKNAVDRVKSAVRGTTTMPSDPALAPKSLREGLASAEEHGKIAARNIFRPYTPPPTFSVAVDNQDREPVEVMAKYSWEGQSKEQPKETVAGKSKRDLSPGVGDKAEIMVRYKDGKTFGPTSLVYATGKPAVVVVPPYTPAPPPTEFKYKVRNDGDKAVEVEINITKSGQAKVWPLMKVLPKATIDLPELTGERLMLTGVYEDGSKATPGTYDVKTQATGVYVVPVKTVAVVQKRQEVVVTPPNPDLQVTALLSYPEQQELVAMNVKTKKREIKGRGETIDGGKLVAVHPLGGVVKMPGDVFFLYPLGQKFDKRVELDTREEAEVPAAIARWNRQ